MYDTQITTMAELEQTTLVGAQVAGVELVAVINEGSVTVFEGVVHIKGLYWRRAMLTTTD